MTPNLGRILSLVPGLRLDEVGGTRPGARPPSVPHAPDEDVARIKRIDDDTDAGRQAGLGEEGHELPIPAAVARLL